MGSRRIILATAWMLAISAAASWAATGATVEKLAEPCRAFNVLAGRYVNGPAGQQWMILTTSNETTHCQLLVIDYQKNEGSAFTAPAGSGAWSLNVVPADRLVVGTYYDGTYATFDLKRMAFTKTAKIKGEDYIWNSVLGGDGRLYGGTYSGAHLAALNLQTFEIEDLGNAAPPNHYLRLVSALPDGRILCDLGLDKPARMIFDTKSHQFSPPPDRFDAGAGVSFQGYFVSSSSWEGKSPNGPRVFTGDTLEPVAQPPFPTPPAAGGTWLADFKGSTPQALLYRQGKIIWRCRAGAADLEKVFDGDLKSGIVGQTDDGKLLCVRGQDYAVVSPGETEPHLRPIPCEKPARPSHFLRVDPQGRIWGGPQFGQTVFYFDPKTRQTVNTGLVCDAGGEVYDAAFLDGKTYLVSYVGGDVIEFDPVRPWDQWHNQNPKTIHHLANEGYVRPIGGVQIGDDGKLYASWSAKYGTYGGAISITDPSDGKTELIENPFGKQAVSSFALDDHSIYAGTDLSANGLPEQHGVSPVFGVIDRQTRQVAYQHPFDGAHGVHHVFFDHATDRVLLSVDQRLTFFGPSTRRFVDDQAKDLPPITSGSPVGLGDGTVYYVSGKRLVQLDLAAVSVTTVAELDEKLDKIAIAPDGTLYATIGASLYRIGR